MEELSGLLFSCWLHTDFLEADCRDPQQSEGAAAGEVSTPGPKARRRAPSFGPGAVASGAGLEHLVGVLDRFGVDKAAAAPTTAGAAYAVGEGVVLEANADAAPH